MEVRLNDLNPLFESQEMRAMMHRKADAAKDFYVGIVTKETGNLARSAAAQTERNAVGHWCGVLHVSASYAASYEFGVDRSDTGRHAGHIKGEQRDLNKVLNVLAGL